MAHVTRNQRRGGVALWGAVSTVALGLTVLHAWRTRHQFYTACVFLATSKSSLLVLANFSFFIFFVVASLVKKAFLGSLSAGEAERLWENTKDSLLDSLLLLTVFRDEFNLNFLAMFVLLFAVKMFHWLCTDRVEFMAQLPVIPVLTHVRTNGLVLFLLAVNALNLRYHATHAFDKDTQAVTVSTMFGFEYLLLMCSLFASFGHYVITTIDLRREGRWEGKGLAGLYVNLAHDGLRLLTYVAFFLLILTYYGLPLHVIRPLYISLHSFRQRFVELVAYRKATHEMERRFPEAAHADIVAHGEKCIVCHCDMVARDAPPPEGEGVPPPPPVESGQRPMKTNCGHIFHFSCLREWLESRPSCPTCDHDVLRGPPAGVGAANDAAAAGQDRRADRRARRAQRRERQVRELLRNGVPEDVARILVQAQQHQPRGQRRQEAQQERQAAQVPHVPVPAGSANELPVPAAGGSAAAGAIPVNTAQAALLQQMQLMESQLDFMRGQLGQMREVVESMSSAASPAALPVEKEEAAAAAAAAARPDETGGDATDPARPNAEAPALLQAPQPVGSAESALVADASVTPDEATEEPVADTDLSALMEEEDPELAEALKLSLSFDMEGAGAGVGAADLGGKAETEDAAPADDELAERRRKLAESAQLRLSSSLGLSGTTGLDDEAADEK